MRNFLICSMLFLSNGAYGLPEDEVFDPSEEKISNLDSLKRKPHYRYFYHDRSHTLSEDIKNTSAIFGISILLYPLTQPKVVRDEGSFKKYGKNFGEIVFDQDEPVWNWVIHPFSGSQLFLFYRGRGYSRMQSFQMTLLSSALFEFFIEIYTEPASIQDLYQTPVFGSVFGLGFENVSMYFLNSGNPILMFFGHAINPLTLFDNYFENKVLLVPEIGKNRMGLQFIAEF